MSIWIVLSLDITNTVEINKVRTEGLNTAFDLMKDADVLEKSSFSEV